MFVLTVSKRVMFALTLLLLPSVLWADSSQDDGKNQEAPSSMPYKGVMYSFSPEEKLFAAYTTENKNKTMIFVHGSPGSWTAFADYLSDPLLQENFNLYAIDRLGFGKTLPKGTERSLKKQAEVLRPLLEQAKEPVILVGHSYGGAVILEAAADYPDKVAGLVFIASSVDPNLEDMKWFNKMGDLWLTRLLIPNQWDHSNQEILALEDQLRLLEPRLSQIKSKMVVIQGTKDTLVPPGNALYIKKRFANLSPKIHWLEGEGHLIVWSHQAFIRSVLLEEFL